MNRRNFLKLFGVSAMTLPAVGMFRLPKRDDVFSRKAHNKMSGKSKISFTHEDPRWPWDYLTICCYCGHKLIIPVIKNKIEYSQYVEIPMSCGHVFKGILTVPACEDENLRAYLLG